ncbi:uncharacterized protein LOC106666328 [Cimex lectularius]|uniref:Uncharacterized protein n=1 Tax=Cimex lectularius TaxID=79782 RepID=A0A8I6RPT6_CIMLE|nr:uncharacterized protein LOC106666328 [Cimex lectularius]
MLHTEIHLLQTIPLLARQSHVSTLQHDRNGMAENVSRFGFTEMMNVLRDAVRQTREPSSCLNAHEVSKYIQSRYGFNKNSTTGLKIQTISHIDQLDHQKKSIRSMSTSTWKETSKEHMNNRAKSLPRGHLSNTPKNDARKTVSGTLLPESPYDYYVGDDNSTDNLTTTNVTSEQDTKWTYKNALKMKEHQKEDEFKERNLRKQAKRLIANVSGSLIPEKSTNDFFTKDEKVQKLASLGLSRSIDSENWYPNRGTLTDRFYRREQEVKESNLRKETKALEGKKASGLSRKGFVYSRLSSKQHAMKQVASAKPKKQGKLATQMVSLGLKAEPEPKTWLQIKALQDKNKNKNKPFNEPFPTKCETMVRRTKEARARLIEDLKLAEQRKQIEVLRVMAKETLNKHLEKLKEQKRASYYV